MPVEQPRENLNIPKNTHEALLKKHDQALEEASEITDRIRRLEEELNLISRKDYPRGDKSKEREIDQELKNITDDLAARKDELAKKWEEIDKIQIKLPELEAKIE